MPALPNECSPVLVVGAGWLGEPLARQLQSDGLKVMVTARKAENIQALQATGLSAWRLDMEDEGESYGLSARLLPFQTIVWAVPPGRSSASGHYAAQLARLLKHWPAQTGRTFVFISSTRVYPEAAGRYEEESPVRRDQQLTGAEQVLAGWEGHSLILRCGGLADERRVIGRYFSGKPLEAAGQPVNHIHRADVIGAIRHLLFLHKTGIYNLVAPLHPTRGEVFSRQADRYGFAPPSEQLSGGIDRLISSDKLLSEGYIFAYPDPADF